MCLLSNRSNSSEASTIPLSVWLSCVERTTHGCGPHRGRAAGLSVGEATWACLAADLTPALWEVSRKPFPHWNIQVRVTCPATEGQTVSGPCSGGGKARTPHAKGPTGSHACVQGTSRAGAPRETGKVSKESSLYTKMIFVQTHPWFRGPWSSFDRV